MTRHLSSNYAAMQHDIDLQQAEIRAINHREQELEDEQSAAQKPSRWRRLWRLFFR